MGVLKEQIRNDLTQAMRDRDELTLSTMRLLKTAITKAEVAGTEAIELDDDAILALLATEVRKRNEAADMYAQGGRTELAAKERAEAEIISKYLPAALSDDALNAIVADAVATTTAAGITGGKAMGAVVKAVREQVGQQADGSRIAAAVKAALA